MDRLTRAQRTAVMRAVRVKNTSAEIAVRRLLFSLGYRYRLHATDLPGKPDIVLRPRHCALFVNGCFWHGHDCTRGDRIPKSNTDYWSAKIARNRSRDRVDKTLLEAQGWKVHVVWECEISDPQEMERLKTFLA